MARRNEAVARRVQERVQSLLSSGAALPWTGKLTITFNPEFPEDAPADAKDLVLSDDVEALPITHHITVKKGTPLNTTIADAALTQQELADLVGVPRRTIRRWAEEGAVPSEARRRRLYRVFNERGNRGSLPASVVNNEAFLDLTGRARRLWKNDGEWQITQDEYVDEWDVMPKSYGRQLFRETKLRLERLGTSAMVVRARVSGLFLTKYSNSSSPTEVVRLV